jgi:carboxyl-terminal processing protease
MVKFRFLSVAALAIVASAALGGIFGRSALATQDRLPDYRVFTAALDAIDAGYIDKVEPDRLVYSSIGGMLQTLDPHSSFMDPRTYAQLRERQEGRYFGLGISILVIDGDITVMNLFEGSPAYKTGIRRGDVIARIEGEDAKGWTSEQAVKKLKGPKGTTVHVSMRRQGYSQLIELDVMRDEINIPSIPAKFMIDGETGYVRLQDFAENTGRDLNGALRELSASGMRRLLLDLRTNPGGPLDQAIRVANQFLPQGVLIVYTRGRVANSDQDYYASEKSEFTELPLVVLVNRNSASASEIVAGALQDHDRGLIVGETTFGKALVQSVYRISDGAGLALTTARYYTPSKRLIQRPWDGTFDDYLTYTLKDQDPNHQHPAADLRLTDTGRKVYSGGGIEPDRRLDGPVEGFTPTHFGRLLYARQVFSAYAELFGIEGDTRVASRAGHVKTVRRDFAVDDAMVKDFREFLESDKMRVKIDEDAFARDIEFIKAMIHYDIDLALYGVSEARRNLTAHDPQAQFALQLFPEAVKLNDLRRSLPKSAPAR